MNLARLFIQNCPPAERLARRLLSKLGRHLTMEEMRDRGGRLSITIADGRRHLASVQGSRVQLEVMLAKVCALPPAISPFDNAAGVLGAVRVRLIIRLLRSMEWAILWGLERKLAEARRLGVSIS